MQTPMLKAYLSQDCIRKTFPRPRGFKEATRFGDPKPSEINFEMNEVVSIGAFTYARSSQTKRHEESDRGPTKLVREDAFLIVWSDFFIVILAWDNF